MIKSIFRTLVANESLACSERFQQAPDVYGPRRFAEFRLDYTLVFLDWGHKPTYAFLIMGQA